MRLRCPLAKAQHRLPVEWRGMTARYIKILSLFVSKSLTHSGASLLSNKAALCTWQKYCPIVDLPCPGPPFTNQIADRDGCLYHFRHSFVSGRCVSMVCGRADVATRYSVTMPSSLKSLERNGKSIKSLSIPGRLSAVDPACSNFVYCCSSNCETSKKRKIVLSVARESMQLRVEFCKNMSRGEEMPIVVGYVWKITQHIQNLLATPNMKTSC